MLNKDNTYTTVVKRLESTKLCLPLSCKMLISKIGDWLLPLVTIDALLLDSNRIVLLQPVKKVAGRLCFYMCLWFCSGGRWVSPMTDKHYISRWCTGVDSQFVLGQHTVISSNALWDRSHGTPPGQTPPLANTPRPAVNERAVRCLHYICSQVEKLLNLQGFTWC